MTTPSPTPTIWALLIGVDCYMDMDRTIADIPRYKNLSGCVNDILLMDEFLRTRLNVPAERITRLTASGSGVVPDEPRQQWPTKANIIAALQALAKPDGPKAGDQVYIHYSGHGGQAITVYPEIKGQEGLDESLVPTDYGQIANKDEPEDRYLRDLEMAELLKRLVDRDLIVTVVLDSCHSGGAARGDGDVEDDVRGDLEPDRVRRKPSHLVAPPEALMAGWESQAGGARAATVASGWLPEPNGYTLLAACRALELAKEMRPAPNGKNHGALTYWLVHTLQTPGLNWEAVHQQVVARVHGAYRTQTPQLQGMGERAVFGGVPLSLPMGVNVLEVIGGQVRLNIGSSGGVGKGAQFFVYRQGVTDFKKTDQRTAVVEVDAPVVSEDGSINGAECWARIRRRMTGDEITPGCQAVLFDPGSSQQRLVLLVRGGKAPADLEERALGDLASAMEQQETHFVRPAKDGEMAYFQVGVSANNTYEIRDAGGRPLPNLPAAPIEDPGWAAEQLSHLAKYFNVLELSSPDGLSRLAGKLEVKLMRTPADPFDEPGGIPAVRHTPAGAAPIDDQLYYLRVRNLFDPPLYGGVEEVRRCTMNVTVLSLGPDYSISRYLPVRGESPYDLGPGETLLEHATRQLPAVSSSLPPGIDEAEDVLKVFATTDTADYDSLLLPSLSESNRGDRVSSPQQQEPERSWITAQVTARVARYPDAMGGVA